MTLLEILGLIAPVPCPGCTFCGGDCTDGAGHACPLCTAKGGRS